jgi:hypothetical protein
MTIERTINGREGYEPVCGCFTLGGHTYDEGQIICFVASDEKRQDDGLLAPAPRLFVVCYKAAFDSVALEPLSWEVAERLAPQQMTTIVAEISTYRSARASMLV